MKVGINLLGLPSLAQGGAGLLSGLEARGLSAAGADVRVLANEKVCDELSTLPPGSLIRELEDGSRNPVSKLLDLASPYGYMAGAAPKGAFDDCDVVRYSFGSLIAPKHPGASVLSAVDLQHLYYPENFSRRDRLIRRVRWHRSIRMADRVTVYATIVKQSLIERLGIDADRIDVVGCCCDQRFYAVPERSAPRGRYLLYPASPLPNKNHARLLRAFREAIRTVPDLKLVLIGPLTGDWAPFREMSAEMGLDDSVEIRGHVSLSELIDLYSGALALVFPSLFEGFGIPVLEALAAGCPAIVSNIPSVTEIAGDAAKIFDPLDEEAIAAAITDVAGAPEAELASMEARGRLRAAEFTPGKLTAALLDSFGRATDMLGAR